MRQPSFERARKQLKMQKPVVEPYTDPLAPEPANPYHHTGPKVYLHSTSTLTQTAILSVNGQRYEYTFQTAAEIDTLAFLFRKVTALAGLNYAKRHSEKEVRL